MSVRSRLLRKRAEILYSQPLRILKEKRGGKTSIEGREAIKNKEGLTTKSREEAETL